MYDAYLRLAKEAARDAGSFLAKRQGIRVDESSEHDIKLSSDKESEKIIIDCISESGLPVLSEECGLVGDTAGLHWIIDPLDGTVNYYKGIDDLCCVSIALFDGDVPVFGIVNRFAVSELYVGVVEERCAERNGKAIKTSTVKSLREAVFATGFPSGMDYSETSLIKFVQRVQHVKKVRLLGSAALMAAFVSCGRIDAYFEQDIRLWDVAGAAAIVKAAGGNVSLEPKGDGFKCDFGAFATAGLMEDFYGT